MKQARHSTATITERTKNECLIKFGLKSFGIFAEMARMKSSKRVSPLSGSVSAPGDLLPGEEDIFYEISCDAHARGRREWHQEVNSRHPIVPLLQCTYSLSSQCKFHCCLHYLLTAVLAFRPRVSASLTTLAGIAEKQAARCHRLLPAIGASATARCCQNEPL